MTILVTGASGHLGANLVRALLDQGRVVRALAHRDRRALHGLDLELYEGDIRDLDAIRRACRGCRAVFHLAAYISLRMDDWSRLHAINVLGTRNIVQACLEAGVDRLIHVSSIHALQQEPLDEPIDEERPLVDTGNTTPYARSKAAAELEVRRGFDRGLDAVILRPTAIIGPHDYRPSHFGAILRALLHRELPALVAGGFDWVDARDVCDGILCAESQAPRGASYMLSGHWLAVQELATLVQDITGVQTPRFVAPMWLATLGIPFAPLLLRLYEKRPLYNWASLQALQSNPNVSHARATRELGYDPRPIHQTLSDTMRWFQKTHFAEANTSPQQNIDA
jgi:dihydroflavonol-4-reductase